MFFFIIIINLKFNNYCFYCFVNLFPNDERVKNYKNKEKAVADFVKQEFATYNWIEDKKIQGGCSKRRPDLLLDIAFDCQVKLTETEIEINNQVIIVEVDENQHEHYNSLCENKRLMELSRDLNHRPLIIIKFNPDNYEKNGKKILSCWSIDKNGLCQIKKNKKIEWESRLNSLKDTINYWITNKTDKTLETIELFYNDA